MASRKKRVHGLDLVDEDGVLCLKGDRLWKWRALEAELRAASIESEVVQSRIQDEIAKTPELGALLAKKSDLARVVSTAKTELATVQAEIEKAFGVSLQHCAFDDKTGRLYNLTSEGERGDPVKPASKNRAPALKRR